ncbi:unnamed protein product, partial [Nesidiocoris tenuis]
MSFFVPSSDCNTSSHPRRDPHSHTIRAQIKYSTLRGHNHPPVHEERRNEGDFTPCVAMDSRGVSEGMPKLVTNSKPLIMIA